MFIESRDEMKKYYISMLLKKRRDGGNKAKQDINYVLAKQGYKEIFSPKFTRESLRYLKIVDSLLTPFFSLQLKKFGGGIPSSII